MSDPDLADQPGREAPCELLPAVPPVAAAVDAALAGARDHRPGLAFGAPHGGEELVRVVLVHQQLDRAGRIRDEEDVLPGLAAVARAVDAPLRVRAEGVPGRGEVREVGVVRVDANAPDLARLAQAQVAPGRAVVVGAVHAASRRDIAADRVGARAHVEDVRVGGRHRDRADGPDRDAVVRDVRPRLPGALGLPDASARGAEVEGVRPGTDAGDRGDAATPERAELAEAQRLEFGRRHLPARRVGRVEGGVGGGLRRGCSGLRRSCGGMRRGRTRGRQLAQGEHGWQQCAEPRHDSTAAGAPAFRFR